MGVTLVGMYGDNAYTRLQDKHQEEYNALPLGFAFSDKQFEEMMNKWGLTTSGDDLKKIYRLGIAGGYIQKKDADLMHEVVERINREDKEAKKDMDYMYWAFRVELANHEYCITYDPEETFDTLGVEWKDLEENPELMQAYKKARRDYLANCEEE